VGEGELEVLGDELLDVGALDVLVLLQLGDAEDLNLRLAACPASKSFFLGQTYVDGPEASTVAGSHVGVESLDGVSPGQLTVLLVHVVSAGARVVADPETEVLDLQGVLLGDLKVPFVSR
jgi:hypothetical protein